MGAFSSLDLMKLGVVVCRIFPILKFHMQQYGGGGLWKTALVTLPPSTSLVKMITGVEKSKLVLITLQRFMFALVLYAVVIAMTSSVTGVLSYFGALTAPVLMSKYGWFFAPMFGSIGRANTETSLCLIRIFRLLNKFWWFFRLDRPQIGLLRHLPLLLLDHYRRRLLSSFWCNQSNCFRPYLLSSFWLHWLYYNSSFSLDWSYQPWCYLIPLALPELLYRSLL